MNPKKNFILIAFLLISSLSFSQDLDDIYGARIFEIYTPFSGISSKTSLNDSLGYNPKMNYWGVLGLATRVSKSKQWGFSFYFGERQLGDVCFFLKGIIFKSAKKNFRHIYYLSDFGLLQNFKFGLNVYGSKATVVNLGFNHSYYIINGTSIIKNDMLCIGPDIYIDRAITDFLAIRLETSPMFSYATGKGKHNINPHPVIWEHQIQVFTKWGLFAELNMLRFSKLNDINWSTQETFNNIKLRRYDLKLGIRVSL